MFYPRVLTGMAEDNYQRLQSLIKKTMYTFSNSSLHNILSESPGFRVLLTLAITKKREIFDLDNFQFDLRDKKVPAGMPAVPSKSQQ